MNLTRQIAELQNYDEYQELHWDGSFEDYLANFYAQYEAL